MQAFIFPGDAPVRHTMTVAFAGHRIQSCQEGYVWQLAREHPMAQGTFIGSSTFQWKYRLVGGTYRR